MRRLLLSFLGNLAAVAATAQALTPLSLSPAPNALSVPRSALIRIELSQPVGSGANTLRVLSMQRGGRLAGTITTNGRILTFTPQQAYLPGDLISVTLPVTVTSVAGTALTAAQVYQFTTATTAGPGTFTGKTTLPGPLPARDLTPADIDGDGDVDILTATNGYNPAIVGVYLNNGYGKFTEGTSVNVGEFSNQVLTADIDGDGDLDLISHNSASISIRFNNGQGVFSGGTDLTGNMTPVVAGDVDGDGDIDLLTSYYNRTTTNVIRLLLNDGTGQFSDSATPIPIGRDIGTLVLGDIDQDGDLDVISDGFGQSVKAWVNDGQGRFTDRIVNTDVNAGYRPLTLADLDGDGDRDLLAYGGLPSRLVVLRNEGPAGFVQATVLGQNGKVKVADLDGDGDLDVLEINELTATVSLLVNNGAGIFTPGIVLASLARPTDVEPADLDGDGDLDVLVADRNDQTYLRFNQALPTLRVTSRAPVRHRVNAPRTTPVTLGFNHVVDTTASTITAAHVFSTQYGGRRTGTTTSQDTTFSLMPSGSFRAGERVAVSVTATERNGNSRLAVPHVFEFTAAVGGGTGQFSGGSTVGTSQFIFRMVPADVDGDGDLDVLSCNQVTGQVQVDLNTGNGIYSTRRFFSVVGDISDLAVADIDGDGDLDVLVSGGAFGYTTVPGRISVCRNNGQGFFSTNYTLDVAPQTLSLTTGDIDGDGDLDIVTHTGISNTSNLAIHFNLGDGTFAPKTLVRIAGLAYGNLQLHDVDNDGDLDLLSGQNGYIAISFNNGEGTFQTVRSFSIGHAASMRTADVDQDGDLDLLTTNGFFVDVLLNDGQGNYSVGSSFQLTTASGRSDLATGDIDGDGDLDVLIGSGRSDGNVSVRFNNGQGEFLTGYDQVVAPGLYQPVAVALVDVDGDGDVDMLAGRFNGGGISVRLNRVGPDIISVTPGGGQVGTLVTITGTNLMGTTSLTLNGVPVLSFTVVSNTSLTFVVPAGATSGPLQVSTPLGSASSPSFLVYRAPVRLVRLSPARVGAGSPPLVILLTGANFVDADSRVVFRGTSLATTFLADTLLMVTLPATLLTTPGTYPISVVTNAPGSGVAVQDFIVTQAPLATQITPVALGGLSVYPNPAHHSFTVQLEGLQTTQAPISLALFNLLGQQVATATLQATGPRQAAAVIPTQQLAAGMYTLRVQLPTGVVTKIVLVN